LKLIKPLLDVRTHDVGPTFLSACGMTALYQWCATCDVNSVCWDLTKLILQLLGAVFIAWFTVQLALRRFKSEKGWERQTSTLADLLIAIDEMHRLNDIRLTAEENRAIVCLPHEYELPGIYGKALSDFEKGAALAAVLLPPNINAIVTQLRTALTTRKGENWYEVFDARGAALQKAREKLIEAGRLQAK
jgi:hypothetical protein